MRKTADDRTLAAARREIGWPDSRVLTTATGTVFTRLGRITQMVGQDGTSIKCDVHCQHAVLPSPRDRSTGALGGEKPPFVCFFQERVASARCGRKQRQIANPLYCIVSVVSGLCFRGSCDMLAIDEPCSGMRRRLYWQVHGQVCLPVNRVCYRMNAGRE
jgi:hypothetical protein